MNDIKKLGFDNWFQHKVDLSKTNDFKIARVISVNNNSLIISHGAVSVTLVYNHTSSGTVHSPSTEIFLSVNYLF